MKCYYSLWSQTGVRILLFVLPIVIIALFSSLVSSSTSNLIAFSALVVSIVFIIISLIMLCWILDKDPGDRQMQDISDPIKEGSEGFFIS